MHIHFLEYIQPGNDGKVVVMKIEEGSPAYWSDLRVGDVITHVQNSALESTVGFQTHAWVPRTALGTMCVAVHVP